MRLVLILMKNPSGQTAKRHFSPENLSQTENKWARWNGTSIHFFCLSNYTNQSAQLSQLFFFLFNRVLPANTAHENPGQRLPPSAANELKPNGSENGSRGPDCVITASVKQQFTAQSVTSALR